MSSGSLKKWFDFNPEETTIKTEIVAGLSTFLTMAYVLAVNPAVLSATGMDKGALFTTTVIASAFACLFMGIYAKMPLGLAPGMGINAFFAYTVCLTMGYSWQFALTAVFIEGLIFILLTVTNAREKLVMTIPPNLRSAIGVGIGLFIAFIGLQNAGIVVKNDATLVSCGDLFTPGVGLAVVGLIITSALMVKKVTGALLIGIVITTLLGIPLGLTHIEGIVSLPPSISPIFLKFQWDGIFTGDMFIVVMTLLFMDLFDTLGTVVSIMIKGNFVKEDGVFPRLKECFLVDAVATAVGAVLGTSAVSTYVESASGVAAGGKSGLTAIVIGFCFLAALFLAPVFLAVPPQATAPALILVGLMMITCIITIPLEEYSESIPVFVCLISIPMTYSIANGIVFGLLSYVFINIISGHFKKLNVAMYVISVLFIIMLLFR